MQETPARFLGQEHPLEKGQATDTSILGLPLWLGEESACNARDLGSIRGLGRSLEKGKATHSSILAWRISLSLSFTFLFGGGGRSEV